MFEAFFAGSAAVDQCVSYDIKGLTQGSGVHGRIHTTTAVGSLTSFRAEMFSVLRSHFILL